MTTPTQGADARELRERIEARIESMYARRGGVLIQDEGQLVADLRSAAAALERLEALEGLVAEMRDHLDVAIQFDHDDHGGCYPSTQWDFTAHELCVMADRLFVAAPGGSHGAGGNTEAAVQDSRPPAGRAETHPLGQHPFPAPGVATPAPAGTQGGEDAS